MVIRTHAVRAAGVALWLGALLLLCGGAADGADAPPAAPPAQPAPPAPAAKQDFSRQKIDLGGGVTFEMVLIPAGEFEMGSPETEEGRFLEPLHRVRILERFWLARTELTQAVWEKVTGANPSTTRGPTLPVTHVSWDDCQAFGKRLNEKVAGGGFRLPTEAEWEYACRAGSGRRFCFGDDEKTLAEYAWYRANSGKSLHGVGLLEPNAWGLFDMHGNVWEYCRDWREKYVLGGAGVSTDPTGPESSRGGVVIRGGDWDSAPADVRAAVRASVDPSDGNDVIGVRVARSVMPRDPPPQFPGAVTPAAPPPPVPKPPSDAAPPALPKPAAPPAKEGEVPSWAKVAPEQIEAAREAGVPVAFENSIGMRFVLIPAGTFTMGSPETEEGREADETQHEVTLTRPYYLGVTEVSNAQYRRFRPRHDSGTYGGLNLNEDDRPAVNMEHADATRFAAWLAAKEPGQAYRLPTESEWERACRAGTRTAYYWGTRPEDAVRHENVVTAEAVESAGKQNKWVKHAVFPGEDGFVGPAPVGHFSPSPWGLHDMLGNVAEGCADRYGPYPQGPVTDPLGAAQCHEFVLRGGAWCLSKDASRAAERLRWFDVGGNFCWGIRLALSIPAK